MTQVCHCRCYSFPHRRDRQCVELAQADDEQQDASDDTDDRRYNSPEHKQADSINRERYKPIGEGGE